MDDDLASYLDLLEKGFGEKAIAMRSESRPGSLLELTTGDTGFENINSKGIEKNRDAVLAFMHVHDLENNSKLLTDAFVAFDVKHARKLAGARTKKGLKQWGAYQATKLISLILLLKKMQRRSPFRSRSAVIMELKCKLGRVDDSEVISDDDDDDDDHDDGSGPGSDDDSGPPPSPPSRVSASDSEAPRYPESDAPSPKVTPKAKRIGHMSAVPEKMLRELLADRPPTNVTEKLNVKKKKKKGAKAKAQAKKKSAKAKAQAKTQSAKTKKTNEAKEREAKVLDKDNCKGKKKSAKAKARAKVLAKDKEQKKSAKAKARAKAQATDRAKSSGKSSGKRRVDEIPLNNPHAEISVLEPYVVGEPAEPQREHAPRVAFKTERGADFWQVRQGRHAICQVTVCAFGDSAEPVARDLATLYLQGHSKEQLIEIRDAFRADQV